MCVIYIKMKIYAIIIKHGAFYTVFCAADPRANYYRTNNLNLRLGDTWLPLDPHPTFLRVTLDQKLTFLKHLEKIKTKMAKKPTYLRESKV